MGNAVNFIIELLQSDTKHKLSDSLYYRQYLSSWVRLKILIPFYTMQYLKNGEKREMDKMERELKIRWFTSRMDYPGTREKVVLLEGPRDSVSEAVKRIWAIIRSSDIPDYLANEDLEWADQKREKLMLLLNNDAVDKHFVDQKQYENFMEEHEIRLLIKRKLPLSTDKLRSPVHSESVIIMAGEEGNVLKATDKLMDSIDYRTVDCHLDYTQIYENYKGDTLPGDFIEESSEEEENFEQ